MSKTKGEGETITAYKAFDTNWQCRGFQYEVGKTYAHDGDAVLCKSGFHACEYPLDVFGYYPPTGGLAVVELSGLDPKRDTDSKRAAKSITIKAALTIPMLVSAAFEYVVSRCEPAEAKHATGDQSASSATGYRSASSATGDNAVAAAFGLESKAQAGKTGMVIVSWWDYAAKRKRLAVGYVGEKGIEPDTFYRADADGKLVRA